MSMDDEFAEEQAKPGSNQRGRGRGKAAAKRKNTGGGSAANSRFCKDHKRSYDSMAYQAKKAEEQGTEGAVEAFNACMASDLKAGEEVKKFAEINPPDRMYS